MRRRVARLFTLFCLLLVGCSISQPPAPIREFRGAKRAPTKPAPAMAASYRVQPGDTLFRVAFDHGLDYRQLAMWNGIDDPARLRAGDVLRLTPPPEAPRAKPVPPPATRNDPVPPAEIELSDDAPVNWQWPAKGEVVTRYDGGTGAKGLDIAGPRGSPILAAAPGRIVYVGVGLRGYGKLIIIKHSKVLLSAYAHNERVWVAEGQTVKLGQRIAEMGDSDADRVKLHFEIREYGKPVDPMIYLPG